MPDSAEAIIAYVRDFLRAHQKPKKGGCMIISSSPEHPLYDVPDALGASWEAFSRHEAETAANFVRTPEMGIRRGPGGSPVGGRFLHLLPYGEIT